MQPSVRAIVGVTVSTVGAEDVGTTHRRVRKHNFVSSTNANTCPVTEGNELSATTMPKRSASASPNLLERFSMRTCTSGGRAAAMASGATDSANGSGH